MSTTTLATPFSVVAYGAASGPDKARMRAAQDALAKALLRAGKFQEAQEAQALLDEALSTSTSAKKKAPIDHAALVQARIATLEEAARLLRSGLRPEGTPEEADLTLPEGPFMFDEEAARKLASASVSRVEGADIRAAIIEAFSDLASGSRLSSQEITNKQGLRSSGAVSAKHATWNKKHQKVTGIRAVPAVPGGAALGYEKV